jgi:hypothetical protein
VIRPSDEARHLPPACRHPSHPALSYASLIQPISSVFTSPGSGTADDGVSDVTSPGIWLDLQSDCELRIARQTTWARVEPTVQTRVA